MVNAPKFDRSLLGSTESQVNVSRWNDVMDSYEKQEYRTAMVHLLDYVNPDILTQYGNKEEGKFSIPHGSIIVNLEISDSNLSVRAPFVKLPENGSVPVLRQVAQLNFWPVGLANIVLDKNDQLTFQFDCPLEMCEPYKIYDVLREICINADRYDDMFVNRFKATPMREPKIERHTPEDLEKIWTKVQEYLAEAQEQIDYFESKRWDGFVWDALILTLMKIDYYCAPQGYVRTQMEDHIDDLYSNRPFNERIFKAKGFIQKLKDYNKEEFLQDVYKSEVFIPFKYRSVLNNIRQNFQQGYNTAKSEMDAGNNMAATLTLLKEFYRLFYYNNVDDQTAGKVLSAMELASEKPWDQSAFSLWNCMQELMSGETESRQAVSYSRSERY